MRNRFGNREVLCAGMDSLSPNIGGTGGIRASANVNSTKAADVPSISPLDAIRNALSVRFEPGTAATIAAADFATGRID